MTTDHPTPADMPTKTCPVCSAPIHRHLRTCLACSALFAKWAPDYTKDN